MVVLKQFECLVLGGSAEREFSFKEILKNWFLSSKLYLSMITTRNFANSIKNHEQWEIFKKTDFILFDLTEWTNSLWCTDGSV